MRIGVALLVLGLLAGCDRRLEPWVPPEQEPAAHEQPVRIPGLERAQPSRPAFPPTPPATELAVEGAVITGQIRLAHGVSVAPGQTLFLIARKGVGGPPLAVQRLQTGTFPMSFTLSQDNVMLPGVIFEGTVNLLARIDADSNAMTREPDAPSAALAGVAVGTNDVDLLLALPQ